MQVIGYFFCFTQYSAPRQTHLDTEKNDQELRKSGEKRFLQKPFPFKNLRMHFLFFPDFLEFLINFRCVYLVFRNQTACARGRKKGDLNLL